MLIASLTGLLTGIIHVFSGPDHIAAVAPFTVEKGKKGWLTGFFWGIGHSSGVWIVGALVFLLREAIPVDIISTWSERFVGVMLIAIGLWGMRRALRNRLHYHEHKHDGVKHAHFHAHHSGEHEHQAVHQHSHVPLGIGLIHGLAGSSHLLGVLPALMLPTRAASIAYIVCFGLGSIAAMSGFSWGLGKIMNRLGEKSAPVYNWMSMSFAVLAILVGFVWLWIGA
jgi:ABC-type nickel/cobalt efflux system permease component RcnA